MFRQSPQKQQEADLSRQMHSNKVEVRDSYYVATHHRDNFLLQKHSPVTDHKTLSLQIQQSKVSASKNVGVLAA